LSFNTFTIGSFQFNSEIDSKNVEKGKFEDPVFLKKIEIFEFKTKQLNEILQRFLYCRISYGPLTNNCILKEMNEVDNFECYEIHSKFLSIVFSTFHDCLVNQKSLHNLRELISRKGKIHSELLKNSEKYKHKIGF
jgi:hypothetical protein